MSTSRLRPFDLAMRVDLREVKKLLEGLSDLHRTTALAVANAQAADLIASAMRQAAPDSGIPAARKTQGRQYKLTRDIDVSEVRVSKSGRSVRIAIRAHPYYALFVERGTRKMKSHRSKGFMRRTANANRARAQEVFRLAVAKAVKEATP